MHIIRESELLRDLDKDIAQKFWGQLNGDKYCIDCQCHILSGKLCDDCKEERKG